MTKQTPLWLSEIEEDLRDRPIPSPRMDRMARVIRELLEACKYAVQFSDHDLNPVIRKRLQVAIRKATE